MIAQYALQGVYYFVSGLFSCALGLLIAMAAEKVLGIKH